MKDEFYVDIVSKTIISKLSDEIVSNLGNQISELIKGLLLKEIINLSTKIKTETELLTKAISETEDSSKLLIKNSSDAIKKHIDEKLEKFIRTEGELKAFIKDELSGIRYALQTDNRHDSFKKTIENQLTSFTSKTKASIDDLRETAILHIDRSNNELKRYVEDNFEKQKRIDYEQDSMIKDELNVMKQFALDVLYNHIGLLESEAEMHSSKKTELERKIKELHELWRISSDTGEK